MADEDFEKWRTDGVLGLFERSGPNFFELAVDRCNQVRLVRLNLGLGAADKIFNQSVKTTRINPRSRLQLLPRDFQASHIFRQ